MPRIHRTSFGLETCMFSAHQMHGEAALHLGASAAMGALAAQDMSLQSMIMGHGLAVVIVGAEIDYEDHLNFFSAPTILADSWVSLRDDGKVLLFYCRLSVSGDKGILISVRARPLRLSGGAALDAAPGAIDGALRARFLPDELVKDVPTRYLQAQIDSWLPEAERIDGGDHPLVIGRCDCELADQWQFARLPSLVAAAREQIAFSKGGELRVGLQKPLKKFRGEWFRPMYFGDRGRIEFEVFRRSEETLFVYRVFGASVMGAGEDKRQLCAIAVETF
jgi:hypothetical protein